MREESVTQLRKKKRSAIKKMLIKKEIREIREKEMTRESAKQGRREKEKTRN